ncbi:MAG: sulfatase-like hydrolase/transferase, partial [Bacteroidota bacterium]
IEEYQDGPFFLYVAHEAPHVPFQGRLDSAYRFPDRQFTYLGPATDRKAKLQEMIEVMDEGVGKVISALERLGLQEETLVFFLSDNGGRGDVGNNGPLRGQKGQLWEGGHRVPAIAYRPGMIERGTTDQLTMSMDIFPTVLSVCGIQDTGLKLDGIDLSPVIFNGQPLAERALFWRYRGQQAARWRDYKLMITPTDTSLFDLSKDLTEQINLSQIYPSVFDDLTGRLQVWQNEMDRTPQITN